jgi:hypothetical protein
MIPSEKSDKILIRTIEERDMVLSRRSVLSIVGGSLAVGLAGCSSRPEPNEENTPSGSGGTADETGAGTLTESSTPPPAQPSLTFQSEVVQQSSDGEPAMVQAHLKNTGSSQVTIGYGRTLLVSQHDNLDLEWATDVVLNWSDDPVMSNENGCWRHSTEATRTLTGTLTTTSLAPGDALSEDFYVLSRPSGPCLPQGNYSYQDDIYHGESLQNEIILTLELHIDDRGNISIRTEGIEFRPGEGRQD